MCVVRSDNYVGGLGAAVLANALQKNTALQELYIKGNELGNEGVKALCGALTQRKVPFRVLDVGNNRSAACVLPLYDESQVDWAGWSQVASCIVATCLFISYIVCDTTIVEYTSVKVELWIGQLFNIRYGN